MVPSPVLLGRLSSFAQAATMASGDGDCTRKSSKSSEASSTDSFGDCKEMSPSISINPEDFVPEDQQIIHQGRIWKLSCSGDPRNLEDYTCVLTWLTSGAGIFYYSHEDDQPLGRNIRGYHAKPLDIADGPLYAFELVPPTQGSSSSTGNTVLATDALVSRSCWIDHISSLQSISESSSDLSPLDMFRSCSVPNSVCNSRTSSRCCSLEPHRSRSRSDSKESCRQRSSSRNSQRTTPRKRSISICSESPGTIPRRELDQGDTVTSSIPDHCLPRQVVDKAFGVNAQLPQHATHTEKANTVLVLDWDDTLFPTTWIRQDCGLDWRRSLEEQLKHQGGERQSIIKRLLGSWAQHTAAFLKKAMACTSVFVVTLAQSGWVDKSVEHFAPQLRSLTDFDNLKVIYAQDYAKEVEQEVCGEKFRSCEQEMSFWTQVKARAILRELQNSHSKDAPYPKSIISFGDAEFERGGTIQAAQSYAGDNSSMQTKTLKLVDEPTVEELNAQLSLLTMWLPALIARSEDIDVEIQATDDDEELMRLNSLITGNNNQLSWVDLAGM